MLRLLLALCFCLQGQTVPTPRLYPIDDTARDSGFRSFVRKLQSAVNSRDTRAFRKLVDDDVIVGPAKDDKGWDKFAARWLPIAGKDSPLWPALADLLSLGFVREHPSVFVSPYLAWRFPPGLDMATHLVVVRDSAPLREAPSLKAPVTATLSFDIVERGDQPGSTEGLVQWVHVRTLDGQSGYMSTRDVMSPLMPRVQIAQVRGRWLLVGLEGPEQ